MESVSPYSQSQYYQTERLERETPDDYEKRTWRDRISTNVDGYVFIQPMAFKKSLDAGAKFAGERIKGKGQATYSKRFLAGVLVVEPLVLPVKKTDVVGDWLFVPSDGVSGSGKRVPKCFPVIPSWKGTVEYLILDDGTINEDVFERTHREAGTFVGIGRFRPERGGFYGRYRATKFEWS
jgi:hypothetical protein